jgi:septum formation protein
MIPIILASTSPRRKKLLQELIGKKFRCVPSAYEEDNTLKMKPKDLVMHHALQKGRDVARRTKGIVISADTLVVYKGKVLGKPHTEKKAREMLHLISGKTVKVITGFAVIARKEHVGFEEVPVVMKKMSRKEIDDYVKTGIPLDRAGAFGIQDSDFEPVKEIKGDYASVVGLPLARISTILKKEAH